ncbi:hypothetical protein ACFWH1_08900 [Streptomyces sp. NPDC127037]|uniref:hypothetical protein n=1 Tax=Streptomyces sp. NPDC127037 TaxID=3347113 RepID=UPI00365C0EAA
MKRSSLRALVVAAATLAGTAGALPAQAAASACTHHFSGPQICISTDGEPGSANPGHVTTAWTNPPKNRRTATVHIKEPDGFRYTVKAHRVRGQLVASFAPGRLMEDGKLCARYAGSSRMACVQIINRM